jgi:hypothetical protein
MDVRIDAARGQDEPLSRDRLRRQADHHPRSDARHHIRIARLADARNPARLDADVGFADAGPVDDERVGNHTVQCAGIGHAGGLPHSVAKDLAAAELALVAVDGGVRLDFRDQLRIGQPDAIAGRGPEDIGVVLTLDAVGHLSKVRNTKSRF